MSVKVPRAGIFKDVTIRTPTFSRTKENTPIGVERIIGVDTESLTVQGKLTTVLTPYSSIWGDVCQSSRIDDTQDAITPVLDFTMEKLSVEMPDMRPSRVISRMGKGTRETIPPVLWVFYNLEYDLRRLFLSTSTFFRFLRTGRTNTFVTCGKYKIQMVACNPSGSAPSFQIIVIDEETKRVVRIYGMDMWGYWKSGLNETAKKLGVGEKLDEVDKAWFDIPLEEWTTDMWDAFIRYGAIDAKLTRGIYIATATLLAQFSEAAFNRVGMLPPSAPAAAARLAFSKASEKQWDRPKRIFEQLALDAYHGGYVGMIRRGYVEHLTVADLHSAYPSAMTLLADPCTAKYAIIPRGEWKDMPPGLVKLGNQGFVRATFVVKPCRFPIVSKTTKKHTQHQPGRYDKFAISLPELSAMFSLGQIDHATIHEGFIMVGSADESFLKIFVDDFYKVKEDSAAESKRLGRDKNNDPVYLIAKLLMNALYGKLIEIHVPQLPAIEHEHDLFETIIFPPDVNPSKCYLDATQLYIDGGILELMLYSSKNRSLHLVINPHVQEKDLMDKHAARVLDILQNQTNTAGAYFMPIHASLITAITRAKIGIMMNCFEAIGGDTDSMFTHMQPNTTEWNTAETMADIYSRRAGCGHVKNDGGLLGYEIEMIGASGYVAGIKQYTLTADGYKPKLAHHALTDPPGDKPEQRKAFCAQAVKQLALGESVHYATRKKPRRLREELLANDGVYGKFVVRVRQCTPKQDERLKATHTDEHGTIHYEWRSLEEFEPAMK